VDTAAAPGSGGGAVQQAWPQVLAALKRRSIVVWANVNTNAQVVGVEGKIVTLGFAQVGAMKNFTGGGKDAVVAAVLQEVLGGTWKVEAVVGNGPAPSGGGRAPAPRQPPAPQQPTPQPSQVQAPVRQAQAPVAPPAPQAEREAPARQTPPATDESWPDAPMPEDPGSPPPSISGPGPGPGLAAARSAAKAAAQAGPRAVAKTGAKAAWPDAVPARGNRGAAPDADEVDPLNDADADVDALTGMALIQRELGGQIIGEIDHT
ncbi:DNA polymerase III subunit gamma and tau, partial [Streptosporangium sp. NPDC006013]